MPKETPLTNWLLQQAARIIEISHRCQQREIEASLRRLAQEFIVRAHREAQLEGDCDNDRGQD
jgi:hypothetical protein